MISSKEILGMSHADVNVVGVHHALLQTGLNPCEVDITVTLPLTEFYDHNNQPAAENIEKKKASLLRPVSMTGGESFKIRSVSVMPESIPAGFELLSELDSLLIVDLGGTTLDISQVRGRMSGITRIHGDATIGVSLVTNAVADALRVAGTRGSSYLADDIIVHHNDDAYLECRINDLSRVSLVKSTINESLERLTQRVLSAMKAFEGYTHVMVIGGGAEIIAEAVARIVV
ncbi:plasmid segregation protein ParM domain-containing protein [Candidatus Pantoea floridensis]|uniref:plasmid segregation protein ParM domain-containing protein n=1 Tax=Candidatus Pantoea floridensis TaxID=1938870 RepID=UPI000C65D031|nr:plasmid segregation protein ParM domain-containing protein [Pantoea floridensis]PIF07560.1 StbA protein [Enterobacteriaceae bacterium JKS000233]